MNMHPHMASDLARDRAADRRHVVAGRRRMREILRDRPRRHPFALPWRSAASTSPKGAFSTVIDTPSRRCGSEGVRP